MRGQAEEGSLHHTKFTTIAHRDHEIFNPVSSEKTDRLLALLDLAPGRRVVDIGCGRAEMLIRAVTRFGASGVGVDKNKTFLEKARAEAAARARGRDIVFYEADIASFNPGEAPFDAAVCIGSTHAYFGYRNALREMAKVVRSQGHLVLGEGFWRRDPDAGYLAALGAEKQDFRDHAGNERLGIEAGLIPLYSTVSTDDEWDHYEGLYCRAVERYLLAHPEDPDSDAIRARIRSWRDAYLRWGRTTLGFAVYVFCKP